MRLAPVKNEIKKPLPAKINARSRDVSGEDRNPPPADAFESMLVMSHGAQKERGRPKFFIV